MFGWYVFEVQIPSQEVSLDVCGKSSKNISQNDPLIRPIQAGYQPPGEGYLEDHPFRKWLVTMVSKSP